MNLIIFLIASVAGTILVDHGCVEDQTILDCTELDGKDSYRASKRFDVERITFTRFDGQLNLGNMPHVRLVEVRYGEPECSQLYSYHGLVVLKGEHSSIFCQIDELTTVTESSPIPTISSQTMEAREEESILSSSPSTSTSSFSTSMSENTDELENEDFTSTVRFIITVIISSFITWIIQDISNIILDRLIDFHNYVIQYIERIERQNRRRRRYPRRIRRRPDFLQYN